MSANKRPNIVILFTHDTGTRISPYGYSIDTPNLQSMAENGALMENYFSVAPVCSPSRGTTVTGKFPCNNSYHHGGHDHCVLTQKTLSHYLHDCGYSTNMFGLFDEADDFKYLCFDRLFPENHPGVPQGAEHTAKNVIPSFEKFVDEYDDEKPFFCWIGLFETHRSFDGFGYQFDDPNESELFGQLTDTAGVREDVSKYRGSIKCLDWAIGKVRESLQKKGIAEDTLFVYTTDHGSPFPRQKGTMYDDGNHIACLMEWENHIKNGIRIPELLSNVDFLPTLMDIVGYPLADTDGKSFKEDILGEGGVRDEYVYSYLTQHCMYRPMRSVRTERYKLIWNLTKHKGTYLPYDVHTSPSGQSMRDELYRRKSSEFELYDLKNDPKELNNLIDDENYAAIKARLLENLAGHIADTDDMIKLNHMEPYRAIYWEKEINEGTLPKFTFEDVEPMEYGEMTGLRQKKL